MLKKILAALIVTIVDYGDVNRDYKQLPRLQSAGETTKKLSQ